MDQHADVWQVLGDLLWNKGLDTKQKLLRLSESTQNRVWFNKKIFCCARALNQHILVLEMNKTITNNKQIPNHNQQQKNGLPFRNSWNPLHCQKCLLPKRRATRTTQHVTFRGAPWGSEASSPEDLLRRLTEAQAGRATRATQVNENLGATQSFSLMWCDWYPLVSWMMT